MAQRAGVPMPRLYIIGDAAPNALSFGLSPGHCSLAVTSGLIGTMDQNEVSGVIAHEISHIANHDTFVTTLAVGTVNVFVVIADMLLSVLYLVPEDSVVGTLVGLVVSAVAVVAEILQMCSTLALRAQPPPRGVSRCVSRRPCWPRALASGPRDS
jgi:heat shock protein HtpX